MEPRPSEQHADPKSGAGLTAATLRAHAEEVLTASPTIKAEFGSVSDPRFWLWYYGPGYEQSASVRDVQPALHVDRSATTARTRGLEIARSVFEHLVGCGFDFTRGSLLEFVCGFGNTLRCFAHLADSVSLVGVDSDLDAIRWCRRALPFADFQAIRGGTVSGIRNASIDAAYLAQSEPIEQLDPATWAELRRVLVPGAPVVAVSTGDLGQATEALGQHFEVVDVPQAGTGDSLVVMRNRAVGGGPPPKSEDRSVTIPFSDQRPPIFSPEGRVREQFQAIQRIWDGDAALRDAYGSIENPEFWMWLHWHGYPMLPEIRHVYYPFPDDALRERVCGPISEVDFRQGGLVDWNRIRESLHLGGFDFSAGGSVLDFGVGCGRILRYFARYAATCRFFGTDVDADACAWADANFDFATVRAQPMLPPSPFDTASFDAIYSLSVFTHLTEPTHRLWLEELHRMSKPGATVVVTLHGKACIDRWLKDDSPATVPTAKQLERALPELQREGYLFYEIPYMNSEHASNEEYWGEFDLSEYGMTFLTRDYIDRKWSDLFEVVHYREAPDGWQDHCVMRALPAS